MSLTNRQIYYLENRNKILEYNKRYYQLNLQHKSEYSKYYYKYHRKTIIPDDLTLSELEKNEYMKKSLQENFYKKKYSPKVERVTRDHDFYNNFTLSFD